MTAADDEAERRWPAGAKYADQRQANRLLAGGFVKGAEWQASQSISEEQVEAAAVALYALEYGSPPERDDRGTVDFAINLNTARALLEAARGV